MKTTLLIPTLNEIEGMKAILPRIRKEWVDEIIVVDGGSTDGSFEYAHSLGLTTLRQKTKGVVGAYWEALEIATGDVIIPFSPDGNSVPERIPDVVEKMKEGYDMVIVSRYLNGAKSEDDDWVTAFGNWVFTKMINVLFGGRYTDALVMFRGWKRELIGTFQMADGSRAGFETQFSIDCARRKLRITEIAGDEPRRIGSGPKKSHPWTNGKDVLLFILKEFFNPPVAWNPLIRSAMRGNQHTEKTLQPWKTLKSQEVYKAEPWVRLSVEQVRLPDGRVVDDYYQMRLVDCAIIFAETKDGLVVMERQYKHGVRKITLTLPTGGIHKGEDPLLAAKRELREETGCVSKDWQCLGRFILMGNQGGGTIHVFKAQGVEKAAEPVVSDLEEMDIVLMEKEELIEAIQNGEISILNSVTAILLATSPALQLSR